MPIAPEPSAPLKRRIRDVAAGLADTPERKAEFEAIAAGWSPAAHAKLQSKHKAMAPAWRKLPRHKYKFLDVAFWVANNMRWLDRLKLREGPKLDILDLGSGGGFFGALATHLGHRVSLADIPDPFFADLLAFQGLKRRLLRVRPNQRLAGLRKRYDLVTAFAINFNRLHEEGQTPAYWPAEAWLHLANDLAGNVLRYPGRILLDLNKNIDPATGQFFYDGAVLDAFERNGALVDRPGGIVTIELDAARRFV